MKRNMFVRFVAGYHLNLNRCAWLNHLRPVKTPENPSNHYQFYTLLFFFSIRRPPKNLTPAGSSAFAIHEIGHGLWWQGALSRAAARVSYQRLSLLGVARWVPWGKSWFSGPWLKINWKVWPMPWRWRVFEMGREVEGGFVVKVFFFYLKGFLGE